MAPVTAASHSANMRNVMASPPRTKSQNFKRESKRLRTFGNWPVTFLRGSDLAKNGFYYTNFDDVVKCAFCKIEIGFWEEGDDPVKDHMKFSPNCSFLKNEACGNVPLSEDTEDLDVEEAEEAKEEERVSQDVCGIYSHEIRPFSGPERPNKDAFSIDSTNLWKDFEELGVSKIHEPVAPNYATFESRLKTFEKWPAHEFQSPEKLAEAGFYYIGQSDNVLCFHCGGGLKHWEKGEDPWVEHARWFSKCHFLFLLRGKDFINEVVLKKKAYLPSATVRDIINSSNRHSNTTSQAIETVQEPALDETSSQREDSSTSNSVESSSIPSANRVTEVQEQHQQEHQHGQSQAGADGKDIRLCRVCYTRERVIVFLPCGHFVCCPLCTSSLSQCAVCREPFKATVRAYLC